MKDHDQDNALLKMFQENAGQFLSGKRLAEIIHQPDGRMEADQ